MVTMNSVRQSIPRTWFPEAITQGKSSGYITDPSTATSRATKIRSVTRNLPAPRADPV
jgi:hypothetical protein